MLVMCVGTNAGGKLHSKAEQCSGSILSLGSSLACRGDDTRRQMFNRRGRITPVAVLATGSGGSAELDITVLQQDRVFNRRRMWSRNDVHFNAFPFNQLLGPLLQDPFRGKRHESIVHVQGLRSSPHCQHSTFVAPAAMTFHAHRRLEPVHPSEACLP